jgi:alkylation response protein AidB-like acyl-CoA dehydrogenase
MSQPTSEEVVAAAITLAPQICAARDEIEATRQIPPPLVQALAAAGLFQLHLPRSMGGWELPPLTAFHAIEALSKLDSAVGWCAMIATGFSLFAGWLPAEVGRAVCGQPPDLRVAGSIRPQGHAYPVAGGYRIRGRWNFASGITHATWLACPCVVMEGEQPRVTPDGTPETRDMWIPATAATIEDTWSVLGMCGTGSHDFHVDDVFVPATHTFSLAAPPQEAGLLYHPRLTRMVLWTSTAANALGMARGALEAFVGLAANTRSLVSPTVLRERPPVQTRVAEAEAILSAARAYVVEAVGRAWQTMRDGAPDPSQAIAHARLAITHALHEAVRVVDLVFHAAGTNAILRQHPLERYFRDIHVAVQHGAGFASNYTSAGKVFLPARCRATAPNKALHLTAYSVRSCVAPAFSSR